MAYSKSLQRSTRLNKSIKEIALGTGGVAGWQSNYLACAKGWVLGSVFQEVR